MTGTGGIADVVGAGIDWSGVTRAAFEMALHSQSASDVSPPKLLEHCCGPAGQSLEASHVSSSSSDAETQVRPSAAQ